MTTITKTIKPGGGGDYTSISSAVSLISYVAGDTINLICSEGDCGWDDITSLAANVTISPATGKKHNGLSTQSLAEIAYLGQSVSMFSNNHYTYTVDGMRIKGLEATTTVDIEVSDGAFVIQNCLFTGDINGSGNLLLFLVLGGVVPITFLNNSATISDTAAGGSVLFEFDIQASTNTTSAIKILGNSINALPASLIANGIFIQAINSGGTATVNLTIQDNFVGGTAHDYFSSTAGGVINQTANGYNASFDATAANFGATGALTGLTPTNLFIDPDTNLHIKNTSSLNGAGIASADIPSDNQGKVRSTPPSIGAFEFVSANVLLGNGLM